MSSPVFRPCAAVSTLAVSLEEGCFITKSVKYTHQVAYMVNAVRTRDPGPIVSQKNFHRSPTADAEVSKEDILEIELKVIPYTNFSLEDPCNLILRMSWGCAPAKFV
jgi:hypothetical protein